MRQQVVNKKQIEAMLLTGGYIKWDTIEAKALLLDNTREVVGTIRFDTYLQLNISCEAIKENKTPFLRLPYDLAGNYREIYCLKNGEINLKEIWR